jgi:hemoglobin/transferrin/lactoferrin receptor protein
MLFRYVFLFLVSSPVLAQNLFGIITDSRTGKPLSAATVWVSPTLRGTHTNNQGRFYLSKLKPGPYQLRVSSVGYATVEQPIVITAQQELAVPISLMPIVMQLNQQTVMTNARSETADFLRPEATSVLTARDLAERAPRTVPEALAGLTGVFLQKTNHGGGSPFVRGLTGQQTLLLIDGIRLNNATFRSGPNQYLNTIDPQSIDRIEVVRSTGSVAYGSDAIGGVVNVMTRTPYFSDKPQLTGSAFGKLTTGGMERSGRIEVGFSSQSVAITAGLAYRKFGDLIAGRGIGRQTPTGYDQWSGDIKARFRIGNQLRLTAAYQSLRQDSVPLFHRVKLENFAYYQFDPQRRRLAYVRLDGYVGSKLVHDFQLTASYQRQTEGRQSQRNNNPTATYERDDTQTTGLSLTANSRFKTNWTAQSGVEFYHDFVGSERADVNLRTNVTTPKRGLYPDQAKMNSLAVFTLHTMTINRLIITAGGRYNHFRVLIPQATNGITASAGQTDSRAVVEPSAVVGNVGLSFALMPGLRLVGGIQSAFRAPNIDDLGTLGIVDFRYETPNTSLTPERSVNKELGLKLRTGRVSATITAYHNQLSGLIGRVRVGRDSVQGYPLYQKENIASAYIRGLEAETEWQIAPTGLLYGGVAYTYGQNESGKEPLRRIPPFFGRFGVALRPGTKFNARAEWQFAGAQQRLAAGDIADNRIGPGGTSGWHVVNVYGGYTPNRHLTISAELHNLANQPYRTHGSGVDAMGRSAWLAVLVSL